MRLHDGLRGVALLSRERIVAQPSGPARGSRAAEPWRYQEAIVNTLEHVRLGAQHRHLVLLCLSHFLDVGEHALHICCHRAAQLARHGIGLLCATGPSHLAVDRLRGAAVSTGSTPRRVGTAESLHFPLELHAQRVCRVQRCEARR
eukprot:scaffold71385_cov54-Phaeocystis_antarctica.AAC.1